MNVDKVKNSKNQSKDEPKTWINQNFFIFPGFLRPYARNQVTEARRAKRAGGRRQGQEKAEETQMLHLIACFAQV
jgi:hypothetical protein